jgi:DNA-binding Lrp family transcriptional regulator
MVHDPASGRPGRVPPRHRPPSAPQVSSSQPDRCCRYHFRHDLQSTTAGGPLGSGAVGAAPAVGPRRPAWHGPSASRRTRMRPIFVMIKCEMGQSYQVARIAADTIEELSELYSTSGQYDLLAKFYLSPGHDTGLFVTERVQNIPGVKDTSTLITFNAFVADRP